MDWLININPKTVVLVPTRGLQHSLSQQYAKQQISAGCSAWQTPQILVWDDYLEQLWHANKHDLSQAYVRLDNAQAYLVWQQVIIAAKKKEDSLLLLNEQQTASVVQRSWKLMQKWRISDQLDGQLNSDKNYRGDIDSQAFAQWCDDYANKLAEKKWLDTAQLERVLVNKTSDLKGLPKELIFAYFDLVTSNQKYHIQACQKKDIVVHQYDVNSDVAISSHGKDNSNGNHVYYWRYHNEEQEWRHVFLQARQQLEQQADIQIGIVIPQLSEQRTRVEQVARSVFYPDKSPLQCQQQDLAYRFSLGQPLNKIAYVYAMLTALALLKNTFRYQELRFLFMCEWWPFRATHHQQLRDLDLILKRNRCSWLSWEEVLAISQKEQTEAIELHAFFQTVITFREALSLYSASDSTVSSGSIIVSDPVIANNIQDKPLFKSAKLKSARQWQSLFSDWLQLLSWQENELDSWHYQVHESWLEVLETFVGYDLVQGTMGLSRALQSLNLLCADKVFMRQAKAEPILISGVLEGIGQKVDFLYVTGMHEAYPAPMKMDPFVSSTSLIEQGYPFADKALEFAYEQNKLSSLLASGKQVHISYAFQQKEGEYNATTLLRNQVFMDVDATVNDAIATKMGIQDQKMVKQNIEKYIDIQGQACMNSTAVRGGSKIFENQSSCPFKAYVEHRILCQTEEEPEFGLDARDAGIVVHSLLENIWQELGSYSELSILDEHALKQLIAKQVEDYLESPATRFQYHRKRLLQLEKPRLNALLFEWLSLEQEQRSLAYSVIGRETNIQGEFGGIPIKLIVDRIDRTDNGECIVIDYKTGQAELSSWQGERPKNPQMPLYALVLNKGDQYDIKGIAFAKIKTDDCALLGITDIDGVGAQVKKIPHNSRNSKALSWQQQMETWQEDLSRLAADFLEGVAIVDPLNTNTCDYCDFHSVCRIHQLRAQTGQEED